MYNSLSNNQWLTHSQENYQWTCPDLFTSDLKPGHYNKEKHNNSLQEL